MIFASPMPAVAAAIVRARRKIAAHFFVHHAVSAEDAVAFVPQTAIQRREFARMQARGVFRAAGGGFWLDTAAYQADNDRRRNRTALILAPVLIVSCLAITYIVMRTT